MARTNKSLQLFCEVTGRCCEAKLAFFYTYACHERKDILPFHIKKPYSFQPSFVAANENCVLQIGYIVPNVLNAKH